MEGAIHQDCGTGWFVAIGREGWAAITSGVLAKL